MGTIKNFWIFARAYARINIKEVSTTTNYREILRLSSLLILDEKLLYLLKETEARDLLEIAEARYKKASTIFCSQFDIPR